MSKVIVPVKCFDGDIISNPVGQTICDGDYLVLSYQPKPNECNIVTYNWFDGQTNLNIHTPILEFDGSQPKGYYWLQIVAANGCTYNTPNSISPKIKDGPVMRITGENDYCQSDTVTQQLNTTATQWTWSIDGMVDVTKNNLVDVSFINLNIGTHSITVSNTGPDECQYSVTKQVNIAASPSVYITATANCAAYTYKITATGNGETGTLNWSNGESATGTSSIILVSDGGPYKVTFTNLGGCSADSQIIIPKFPDNFLWVFPTGCYEFCSNQPTSTVLGPLLPLTDWEWSHNGQITLASTGIYSTPFMPALAINESGTYNMNINTGDCEQQSLPMNVSISECARCENLMSGFKIKYVKPTNDELCSYNVLISLPNPYPFPVNVTIVCTTNQMILSPTQFLLNPLSNSINLNCVPLNGFNGGTLTFALTSVLLNGNLCTSNFSINFPFCDNQGIHNKTSKSGIQNILATNNFEIAPNPVADLVKISYTTDLLNAKLTIHDLTGRLIQEFVPTGNSGEIQFSMQQFAAGIYVVALRQNGQMVLQKQLVKK